MEWEGLPREWGILQQRHRRKDRKRLTLRKHAREFELQRGYYKDDIHETYLISKKKDECSHLPKKKFKSRFLRGRITTRKQAFYCVFERQ